MASYINTNISSLNAQRNLASSQSALQTSLQRLSSGLRINSAKDDAAGLAISQRMTTQINGLDQAQRNANDGISLAQTGDGALSSISDNLQRIRELAVQAANSTNSDSDRTAIQQEVQQRLDEIDRVASQTSFNGQKLLDGSFKTASFQVGANVGETISVNLDSSMRTDSLGSIASVTSTAITGATGSKGSVETTSAVPLTNYGQVDALAQNSISPTTFDFTAGGTPQVNGSNNDSKLTSYNTTNPTVAVGFNSQSFDLSSLSNVDMSGTKLLQFDVSASGVNSGAAIGITLNQDYTAGGTNNLATSQNALVADVQSQLDAAASGAFQVSYAGGQLKIADVSGQANQTDAVTVSGTDANAQALGMTDTAGTAGVAAGAGIKFTVDTTNVALNTAYATKDDMAAAIATQLGANYTVAIDNSGNMSITHAGTAATDTNAVVISNADAAAQAIGVVNSSGTAGTLAQSTREAKIMIDSHEVDLSANYGSFDGLANEITTQLGGTYAASYDATSGKLTITNSDANATGLSIAKDTSAGVTTVEQDNATAAGFQVGAGTAPTASTAKSFTVDGTHTVTLNQDYTSKTVSDLVSDVQAQLGTDYTVSNDSGKLKIASATSLTAPSITSNDLTFDAGVAGVAAGINITSGNFSINGIEIAAGNYDGDALAARINSQVSGVNATYDKATSKLNLSSAADIKLAGSDLSNASGLGGALTSGTTTVGNGDDTSFLASVDVSKQSGATTAILRIDSALNSVNSLRGTFGAIQNRFDSVISNLSSTSENLSAARSRIQDADFASETASLTRGQILQQAGTAMLAQANSLPNGVLALLR